MHLPDFLRDVKGEILLTGHRIGLLHIVKRYNDGYSPEMLVGHYPTLPLALVHKTIAFYLENRSEVDAYVNASEAELDRQWEEGTKIDLDELRERMKRIQQSESATVKAT